MSEREIFQGALDCSNPAQIRAYLDQACGNDAALRARIEALLQSHEAESKFLNVPAVEQLNPATAPRPAQTMDLLQRGEVDSKAKAVDPGDDTPDEDALAAPDLSFLSPPAKPGALGTLGHYEVLQLLGQGAFGLVFKAFDTKLHRHVAIKVMNPQLAATSPPRKRFLREARSAAAIKHENIVQVYSVEEQPLPYLVMEYVDGQTLKEKLDGSGPLETPEILHLGGQMARGLAAAHAQGLIHRDIKPGNILIEAGAEQKVKITDFGLARAADDATITRTGVISGTPLFMAPEQALGLALDHRADLFSLGSVLYQMACGRPPFRGASALAVLKRVADEAPRPIQEIIAEVPGWLCAIIAKLQAKKPEDRFQSAKEVADLLARCQASLQQHGRVELPGDCVPFMPKAPAAATPRAPAGQAAPVVMQGHRVARRRLVAAAAAVVALFVGMSLTEATGVTNLRGTVMRLFAPDGTLVVEVDDPGVSISIDGEEMVITGTGAKEIRLKPGQYKVLARKDGTVVQQELVTVTRNGRQVLRVSKEVAPVLAAGDSQKADAVVLPRFKNSLGMEFALVPRGKAWLGGGGGKVGDKEVEFKDDFNLGVYEVTQEEWLQLMGNNPSYFSGDRKEVAGIFPAELKRFPVEGVTWYECEEFVQRLNAKVSEAGWTYRLPMEAEWEYACRGGPMASKEDSKFHYHLDRPANALIFDRANFNRVLGRTQKVGAYPPNRLGLYDMHGNVWEFCADRDVNAKGESVRVLRGGGWHNSFDACRASNRNFSTPTVPGGGVGLRVARVRIAPLPQPAFVAAPYDEKQAKAHQEEWAKHLGRKVVQANSLDMKMALIPPGKFRMGANEVEKDGTIEFKVNSAQDEKPQRLVELPTPFVMGATEVTQEQFEKLMGRNPSSFAAQGRAADKVKGVDSRSLPVESVSWFDAVEFCNKLSTKEALAPYYDLKYPVRQNDGSISEADVKELGGLGYRLPTEAEWEYACRAGTATPFSFEFNYGTLPQYGWFGYDSKRPHAVGERKPNAFGLYDMHGNVFEWCSDWFGPYVASSTRDPRGPAAGSERVMRGGAWNYLPQYCRSASRMKLGPRGRLDNIGFRVAHSVTTAPAADPDRRAAVWVLSLGGNVHTVPYKNGPTISKVEDLPAEPFELRAVSFDGSNPKVADAGLAHLQDCKHLTLLDLRGTPITNAGLAHLSGLTNLSDLGLARTKVADEGLVHLKNLGNLVFLNLDNTAVTGEGLVHVKDNKNLKRLQLAAAPLNDAAFDHLQEMTWLEELQLDFTRTNNADLARLAKLTNLRNIQVEHTKIGAGGLAHLKDCKKLAYLGLAGTRIANADLAYVGQFKNLVWLELNGTPISDEGVAQLKDLVKMEAMNLSGASLSRAGLLHLKDFKHLIGITLNSTGIGDESVDAMLNWPKMGHLRLLGTKITDAGARTLAEKLPGCRVEWDGGDLKVNAPADRRAAEWVLSIGGSVRVSTKPGLLVTTREQLPMGKWELRMVNVAGNSKATDDGLAAFVGCKSLQEIYLASTPVTDAGLAAFKDCKDLLTLDLARTAVTDVGLAVFRDRPKLEQLCLSGTGVTDAGLALFAGCKDLRRLLVAETAVGDVGLAHFKDCKKLRSLDLNSCRVTDAGLAHVRGCTLLMYVHLAGRPIGDAGVAVFKDCHDLLTIDLTRTQVGDAGLEHLAGLKALGVVKVKQTKVTETAVKKLAAALPRCRIEWEGMTIEPTVSADPDRRAAEWVLSIGGNLEITDSGEKLPIAVGGDLPASPFALTSVVVYLQGPDANNAGLVALKDCKSLTALTLIGDQLADSDLVHFKDVKNLTTIALGGKQITDAGVANFKNCKNLYRLYLDGTQVTDAGLAHFKGLTNLALVRLNETQVTDAGLSSFKTCEALRELHVSCKQISDAGVAHLRDYKNLLDLRLNWAQVSDGGLVNFKDYKRLGRLELEGTRVTDAGLPQLNGLTTLHLLRLQSTKVTAAGVRKLAAALPNCQIEWDGGVIAPTGVADPDRRAAEWVLSIGASMRIVAKGVESSVAKDGQLPDGPFHVVTVFAGGLHIKDADLIHFKDLVHLRKLQAHEFFGNKDLTDAGLEHLLGLKALEELDVYGSQVSDVGVERLTIFKKLRILQLGKTKITDAALAHVAGLGSLQNLGLSFTRVTNDGLKQLEGLANLVSISLERTQVSDDGLRHLQTPTELQSLTLTGTKVTGAGLDHLKGLGKLKTLYLDLTPTSDDGLSRLRGRTNLTLLGLQATQVTDAGLEHLASLTGLEKLNLRKTKVSAEAVSKLGAALPRCTIEWEGGVIGPKISAGPDR